MSSAVDRDLPSNNMARSVLVVGAGTTGSIISALLRRSLPADTRLCCWEKSRGAGGRMSTKRVPESTSSVDLGAQYVTIRPSFSDEHKKLHAELYQANLLTNLAVPFVGEKEHPEGTKQFVATKGISSIAKHFLKSSKSEATFGQTVEAIDLENNKWRVSTVEGKSENFNQVILTQPVPQILDLKGYMPSLISKDPEVERLLEDVEYSSRYALGLFFSPDTKIDVPWTATYIRDDPCIRFISIDTSKRLLEGEAPTMAIHTSVPFGLKHLEHDKDGVQAIIMDHLKKIIPNLPKPNHVICQRWRYSQVFKSYARQPGCIVLQKDPLLVLAGDGFTHSNLNGCITSALAAVDKVKKSAL